MQLIASLAVFLSSSVSATVLDQEYADTADRFANIGQDSNFPADPDLDIAQTFTVGQTGVLTGVEVFVRRSFTPTITDPLVFDIRTTVGGSPTEPDSGANVLASISAAASSIPTVASFVGFDLSGFGISVTAGDVLAIVLQSDGPNPAYAWGGTEADGYSPGASFRRTVTIFPTWMSTGFANDQLFRTFVEPSAAAPVSTTLPLLMIGLFGFYAAGYRMVEKTIS